MKANSNDRQVKIGDVYYVEFQGTDSEQKGIRPAVVFQNNVGNEHSPNVVILPLTSSLKKRNQPTHVVIPASVGLKCDSMVLCENPKTISKHKLGKYITTLTGEYMEQIAVANIMSSAAISFIHPEMLMAVWESASKLN